MLPSIQVLVAAALLMQAAPKIQLALPAHRCAIPLVNLLKRDTRLSDIDRMIKPLPRNSPDSKFVVAPSVPACDDVR